MTSHSELPKNDGVRRTWRRIPVFIASTFRDMDYERDMITRQIIPAVNKRISERYSGVAVYSVDLRSGVETDDRLDPETRQRTILQTCVAEVGRCRVLLALVGNKYGWMPPGNVSTEVREGAGLADPGFPLSVTAIELLAAGQRASDGELRPVVLVRRPSRADRMVALLDGFVEDLPGSDGARHLEMLLRELNSRGIGARPYTARWNRDERRYESSDFAELATSALVDAVLAELREDTPVDWLDRELAAQRHVAEREAGQFVGRAADLEYISEFWEQFSSNYEFGDDPTHPVGHRRSRALASQTLAIVAGSGAGKSALLAKVALDLSMPTPIENILKRRSPRAFVQVAATGASRRLPVCLLVLLAQLDSDVAHRIASATTPESMTLKDVLDTWLRTVSGDGAGGPLVVVDGLDRIEAASPTESISLSWLPSDPGHFGRFLVSCTDDLYAKLLAVRPRTEVYRLKPLVRGDAALLVRSRAAANHKSIAPTLVDSLVDRSTSPRWLVVAAELLLTLMTHDYLVVQNLESTGVASEEAIAIVLASVADDLPEDLDGLHEEALRRIAKLVDSWFWAVLIALGASIVGLRERDLHAVLELFGSQHTPADFALTRDLLSAFVTVTGDEWVFAHQSARGAVLGRFSQTPRHNDVDLLTVCRIRLADHLQTLPVDDPVRERELLPVLALADDFDAAARIAGDPAESTHDAVTVYSSILGMLAMSGFPVSYFEDLVRGARSAGDVLVAVQSVCNPLQVLGRADARRLSAVCRDALSCVPSGVVDRFGNTVDDVWTVVDRITADPLAEGEDQLLILSYIQHLGEDEALTLADAPFSDAVDSAVAAWIAGDSDAAIIVAYARATLMGRPSAPTDPVVAMRRLTQHSAAIDDEGDHRRRRFLELSLAVAHWACHAAWPDAGFTPDQDDHTEIKLLVERYRGLADYAILLGRSASIRATELIAGIDLDETLDDWAADHVAAALDYLDDALWALAAQRAVTPDSVPIAAAELECLSLHVLVLAACEQRLSAAKSETALCLNPLAERILGWESFAEYATSGLAGSFGTSSFDSARTLIEHAINRLDERRRDGQPIGEMGNRLELILVGAAFEFTMRRELDWPFVTSVLSRAVDLVVAGQSTFAVDDLTLDEIVDEFLTSAEDSLVEDLIEIDQLDFVEIGENLSEVLAAADVDSKTSSDMAEMMDDLREMATAMEALMALRTIMLRYRSGHQPDIVGALLASSFAAWIGLDGYRAKADELWAAVKVPAPDTRESQLIKLAGRLTPA